MSNETQSQEFRLYHVIYRGVDGRHIFKDDRDRARFVHDLYGFNDIKPADTYAQRQIGHDMSDAKERIVNLHGWKLMPNHAHLLLSEQLEQGLSTFLRKMRGYGRYFNERHARCGRLFDTTKKILIESEEHFLYILHYIHLNGLDDFPAARSWRERDKGTVRNIDAALKHLKQDTWSSIRDYCGIKNYPHILTKDPFETDGQEYERSLREYLSDREQTEFVAPNWT